MSPSRQRSLIAVTGVSFESRIVAGAGVAVICGAGDRGFSAALMQAVARGAQGIVSFGIAGGLCEKLTPGRIVVPEQIVAGSQRLPTDRAWSDKLRKILSAVECGDIVGVDAPAAETAQKRALRRETGAVAVDMESHIAAEVAARYAIPFVALRVISDPFDCALPPAALVPLDASGRPKVAAVLRSIALRPSQMPLLMRTARDVRRAKKMLLRSREMLGATLGFPDLG